MKKGIIYLSSALLIIFTACEEGRRDNQGEDRRDFDETASDVRESVENVFTTTYEDLQKDKRDLEEEVNELKRERNERAGTASAEFDRHMSYLDERLKNLEVKAEEFRNASNDDRQEQIKKEFDQIEDDIESRIKEVKDKYKKQS